jgi:hypothetical protein
VPATATLIERFLISTSRFSGGSTLMPVCRHWHTGKSLPRIPQLRTMPANITDIQVRDVSEKNFRDVLRYPTRRTMADKLTNGRLAAYLASPLSISDIW